MGEHHIERNSVGAAARRMGILEAKEKGVYDGHWWWALPEDRKALKKATHDGKVKDY